MEKGVYTFFFGKRNKVKYVQSPFSYIAKESAEKQTTPSLDSRTLAVFIKQCDFEHIFDKVNWKCVSRDNPIGEKIALDRLNKYINKPYNGNEIKGLLQFEDNCWFNSLLMCLFFSDGSRRMMNNLRKSWITSNVASRRPIYNVFTHLMELAHYNKEVVNNVNSNIILAMLHAYDKNLFEHPGYAGGSGILYCKKLLEFLGMNKGYMEIRFIYNNNHIYVEINGKPEEYLKDITALETYISEKQLKFRPKMMAVFFNLHVPFQIPLNINHLELDSVYIANYKSKSDTYRHAVAGITCNGNKFIYDGERARHSTTLKPFNWSSSNVSFAMTYDRNQIVRYDFTKGVRVAFFIDTRV